MGNIFDTYFCKYFKSYLFACMVSLRLYSRIRTIGYLCGGLYARRNFPPIIIDDYNNDYDGYDRDRVRRATTEENTQDAWIKYVEWNISSKKYIPWIYTLQYLIYYCFLAVWKRCTSQLTSKYTKGKKTFLLFIKTFIIPRYTLIRKKLHFIRVFVCVV